MTLTILIILTYFGRYPLGRLIYFSLGAILCLGPAELTTSKVYYLFALIIFSLLSLKNLSRGVTIPRKVLRRVKSASIALIILLFINFFTSLLKNFSLIEIIRGQTGLLIFLLGIPIAVWSGRNLLTETILDYAILLGVFSAFAFWYVWSQNRGLLVFQNSRFALASEWTAFLCLAITFTSAKLHRIRSLTYSVSSLLIIILMLASLTRTNILLSLWILFISIASKSGRFLSILKIIFLASVGFFSLSLAAPSLLSSEAFVKRINESWTRFLSGGFSSSGLGSDGSLVMRRAQAKLATELFYQNPIVGSGQLPSNQTLDTIIATPAQFGVTGIFLISFIIYQLYRVVMTPKNSITFYAIPFFSAFIPASLIYNWLGGRSIWITLIIVLALALSQEKQSNPNEKATPVELK
jgi:hypothetical protein